MAETTQRTLRLLTLLESRPSWSGTELARRLGVTPRTVRRDVVRLRELGYPVEAEPGTDGGYRLGAGAKLPPLVLDDDEAVALVACLRMGATSGQDSIGEAALRALTKLDQVMPPRLRGLAEALDAATQTLPHGRPAVDWRVLSELAMAHRAHRVVRFQYAKTSGEVTDREVEPARLMTRGQLWYLQAWDRGRADWRVFRLDRMQGLHATSWTFDPRPAPTAELQGDVASHHPCVATVRLAATPDRLTARIPPVHRDEPRPTDAGCRVRVGSSSWDDLAWHLLWVARDLGVPLVVVDDQPGATELRTALHRIAEEAVAT